MVCDLILSIIAGVVVRGERLKLGGTSINGFEHRANTQSVAHTAHNILRRTNDLRNLSITEAVALCQLQDFRVKVVTVLAHQLSHLIQQNQLIQEPRVNLRCLKQLLNRGTGQKRLLHLVDALGGGYLSLLDQLGKLLFGPLHRSERERGPLLLQRAHGLLKCFGEVTAQRHCLTHRFHGGGEGWISGGELLERETRHLNDHIVEGRLERCGCLLGNIVRNLIQGVAQREFSCDLSDREPGCFGSER